MATAPRPRDAAGRAFIMSRGRGPPRARHLDRNAEVDDQETGCRRRLAAAQRAGAGLDEAGIAANERLERGRRACLVELPACALGAPSANPDRPFSHPTSLQGRPLPAARLQDSVARSPRISGSAPGQNLALIQAHPGGARPPRLRVRPRALRLARRAARAPEAVRPRGDTGAPGYREDASCRHMAACRRV